MFQLFEHDDVRLKMATTRGYAEIVGDTPSSLTNAIVSTLATIRFDIILKNMFAQNIDATSGRHAFLISLTTGLAISIAKARCTIMLQHFNDDSNRLLATMLFVLDTSLSQDTFSFWSSFAEASTEVNTNKFPEGYLLDALTILLRRCNKRFFHEARQEYYREEVRKVFENICKAVDPDLITAIVRQHLDNVSGYIDQADAVSVCLIQMELICSGYGDAIVLLDSKQESVF